MLFSDDKCNSATSITTDLLIGELITFCHGTSTPFCFARCDISPGRLTILFIFESRLVAGFSLTTGLRLLEPSFGGNSLSGTNRTHNHCSHMLS